MGNFFRDGYLAHDETVVAMEKGGIDVCVEEIKEGAEKTPLHGARPSEPTIISVVSG